MLTFTAVGCTSSFVNDGDKTPEDTAGGVSGSTTTDYSQPADLSGITLVTPPTAGRSELSVVEAIKKVEKSVVSIDILADNGSGGGGAGVIVDMDIGENDVDTNIYVLTCHHVIADKGSVTIYIPNQNGAYNDDGYTFTGRIGGKFSTIAGEAVTLIGGDKPSDIALLKIDLTKTSVAGTILEKSKITETAFAPDSYRPSKGEEVFSIGSPLGYDGWCDVGIISALGIKTTIDDIGEMELIGMNLDTTFGSSGGGLFNLYGELIGITNAGRTDASGKNFAIPLYTSNHDVNGAIDNGIINIITQLAGTYTDTNYGYVSGRREMFGFTISHQHDENTGLPYILVIDVTSGSLAARAGLKINDEIVGYTKGTEVNDACTYEQLNIVLSGMQIGDTVTLSIIRIESRRQVEKEISLTARQAHFCDTGLIA